MNRLKRALPFITSLTLHLAVIFLLSLNLSGNGENSSGEQEGGGPIEVEMVSEEQGKAPEGQNDEVIPKQVEVEELPELQPPPLLQEQSEIEIPTEEEPPKPVEGITQCENDMWFGGIGIQQDWRTGMIEQVFGGYPAEKAGLRPGDIIESVNGEKVDRIRGEPGTVVVIGIFRPSTNEYLTFSITRDKICLGKRL